MKITKKILAVILAGIMLFTMFSVSVSAKEMTKSEVVKFYHSILKETAEKNKMILVENESKSNFAFDFSGLSGLDLKLTENVFSALDTLPIDMNDSTYYYGVCGEYEDATDTEIYEQFNISWELDEWGYVIKDAIYEDDKIIIELEDDEMFFDILKITIELTDDNVIRKITRESHEELEMESLIKKAPFMITSETIDIYNFVYDEVPATSLTLSETNITLGYEGVAEITYTVGPENASFKDVYVDVGANDVFTPVWAYEEDGKIIIEALSEGAGIVEVCTYSGDVIATCQVNVEYSTWDRIVSIFDSIMSWLKYIFGIGF